MDAPFLHATLDEEEFRLRAARAVKSGNPRWFWPEVGFEEWTSISESIGQIASDVLVHGRSAEVLTGSAAAISVAAFTSGMGPLLAYWHGEGRFDASDDAAAVVAHHFAHNQARMQMLAQQSLRVVDRLKRSGVPATILKGMHTAFAYFPHPGTRPMSDIDILVDRDAEPNAAPVLVELGYRPAVGGAFPERTWRMADRPVTPRNLYFVHQNDQWSLDLHLTADLQASPGAPRVRVDRAVGAGGGQWGLDPVGRTLEHPALLIHLAAHAGIHLLSLTLLRLTELVFVIRQDTQRGLLSWDELSCAGERIGALGALFPAFELSERLAPGTIPEATRKLCRQRAPAAVFHLIDSLTPASAHAVLRCSVEERFMWSSSKAGIAKQAICDLLPVQRDWPDLLRVYRMMAWRLLNMTVTR